MQLRRATPAIVLGLMALVPVPTGQSDTARYRFEINTESVTDLTDLGQGEMTSTVTMDGVLSVTLGEVGEGGSRTATVVLDTIGGSSSGQGQQITPKMLADLQGTTWHGTMNDKGRLTDLVAEHKSQGASQLEGNLLRGLFPFIKAGAAAGDTWTDTLKYSHSEYTMKYDTTADSATGVVDSVLVDSVFTSSQETTTDIQYTAAGDTTYQGTQAQRVEAVINSTTAIYQEAQGFDIEGTSTGAGVSFIGPDGRYLGGTRDVETELEVSGAQLPAVIPVTATTTLKVELLP